jgi:MFS family permease
VPANSTSLEHDGYRVHRAMNYVGAAVMDLVIACTALGLSLLGSTPGSPFNVSDFYSRYASVLAVAGLATALGSIYLSRLSDRFGRKPVLLVSLVGIAATSLAHAWAVAWWHLYAIIIVRSAFFGMFWPSIEARITDGAEGREMTRRLGIFGIAFSVGLLLGYPLGGWLHDKVSPRTPFYVAAGFGVLLFVMFAAVFRRDPTHDGHKVEEVTDDDPNNSASVPAPMRRAFLWASWLGNAVAYGAVGILRNMFTRFVSLDTTEGGLGFTGLEAGVIAGAICAAMLCMFVILGKYHFWHYRFRYLAGAQLMMLLGAVIFATASTMPLLVAGALLFGAGSGVVYMSSIYYSLAGKSERAGQSGLHEGIICFGWSGGMVVVAAVSAFVVAQRAPYWVCVGLLVAGAAAQGWLWLRARRAVRHES